MSESQKQPKRRSVTSISLGWIAERIRRAEKIKEAMKSGTYTVDSNKVAQSIVNKE